MNIYQKVRGCPTWPKAHFLLGFGIPADLTYDYPEMVWTFFAVILLWGLIVFIYRFRKQLQRLFNFELTLPNAPSLYWLKAAALVVGWILAVIALMGPKGNGHYPEEELGQKRKISQEGIAKRKAHDVVFFIDASASMGVKDSRNGIARLEAAKEIADLLISRLEGDSIALYAFTYETAPLSPATLDTLYVRLLLRSMKINEGDTAGTSLSNALETFQKKYLAKPGRKLVTLILLSDGEDNQLKSVNDLAKYIQGPSLAQTQLFTIGMGTDQGGVIPQLNYEGGSIQSRLNPIPLEFIAQQGRGHYFVANDYTPSALVEAVKERMDKVNPFVQPGEIPASFLEGKDNLIYDLYFQIPLAGALLCFAFYLFAPNTWRRIGIFAILLVPSLDLYSIDVKQAQEAAQYVEAGLFDKGEGIYLNLLNQPLKQWEEGILTYNLGTTELIRGNPNRALDIYERVPLGEDASPLLQRNLRTNRALAFYQKALNEPLDALDSYEEAIYALLEAQSLLSRAEESSCAVEQIEGKSDCFIPEDLAAMDKQVKLKLAHLFKGYLSLVVKGMGQGELLVLLTAEVEQIERNLQMRELVKRDLERWQPIWERLPSDSTARKLFPELLNGIIRGKQSNVSVKELLKQLHEETAAAFENNPEKTKATVLRGLYQFALLQNPPVEENLKALTQIEGGENPNLSAAIAAQEKGEIELARFYLLAARPSFTFSEEENGPTKVLSETINLQEQAMRLNRFSKRIPASSIDQKVNDIIKTAQDKSFEASQPFLSAAYEAQRDKFNDPSLPLESRCQAQPWNEVIALYIKGREHAQIGRNGSLNEQSQALAYWKEALNLLKKESGGKGCPGGSASPEEQETVKNIQEMDQDDRAEKKTSAVQVEGVRPW